MGLQEMIVKTRYNNELCIHGSLKLTFEPTVKFLENTVVCFYLRKIVIPVILCLILTFYILSGIAFAPIKVFF